MEVLEMIYRAKTDANHTAIGDAFRAAGCTAQSMARLGKGVPDWLIGVPDYDRSEMRDVLRLIVVEVKTDGGALTDDQVAWHAQWAGAPIFVVTSVADVPRVIEEARS